MRVCPSLGIVCGVLGLIVAGCGPAQPPPSAERRAPQAQQPGAPKRMVAAIKGNPVVLTMDLNPAGIRGVDALEELLNVGLTIEDNRTMLVPKLAEAVPSIENGLWKVFPDGRMETTWKIREGAKWHDGTPLTADDFLFTVRVRQDRELPDFHDRDYDRIEGAEAPDPRAITLSWKRSFIEADGIFSDPPLPKHLVERAYVEDKATFEQLAAWSTEFIGTGPFKLREWVGGSHLIVDVFDGYVLGRPKIDEIEIKFIEDANTMVASLLSGAVELSLGLTLSLEQAVQLRDQWRDGKVEVSVQDWVVMFPQFIDANPPIITNLQFRRAVLHAIARQEMAETIQFGMVPVAHAIVYPDTPAHRAVEPSIVRYDHDPRQATQMIEALGYRKGPDGIFRDPSDRRLSVEINWSQVLDINEKSVHPVAGYWQQVGVGVDLTPISPQLARDRKYRASFPGFALQRQPAGLRSLTRYHGSEARTAERNYTGGNNARYINPEFDAMLDRYFTTIPNQERLQALAPVIHHMTDQLIVLPLFYDTKTSMIGNRLQKVTGMGDDSTQAWNAHEWDVR